MGFAAALCAEFGDIRVEVFFALESGFLGGASECSLRGEERCRRGSYYDKVAVLVLDEDDLVAGAELQSSADVGGEGDLTVG
ncbi:MAG TPA: hypothetical protein PKE40_08750 [Arachnia sp.]|nr:hypothetical protein [Arachnia sp.]HMT86426.1 hypothetical protein [Arachnia sp.]